jgi:hypothetical protein
VKPGTITLEVKPFAGLLAGIYPPPPVYRTLSKPLRLESQL